MFFPCSCCCFHWQEMSLLTLEVRLSLGTMWRTSGLLFTSCSRSQRHSQNSLPGETEFVLSLCLAWTSFTSFSQLPSTSLLCLCVKSWGQRWGVSSHWSSRLSTQMAQSRHQWKQGENKNLIFLWELCLLSYGKKIKIILNLIFFPVITCTLKYSSLVVIYIYHKPSVIPPLSSAGLFL